MLRTLAVFTLVAVMEISATPSHKPQAADSTHSYDSLVVMPTPIQSPAPTYPEVARKKAIQGTIWLEVQVLKDGKVGRLRVVKNQTGSKDIEKAAMTAAKQWLFKPATKDDKPVEVWVSIPFAFKLDNAKSKEK